MEMEKKLQQAMEYLFLPKSSGEMVYSVIFEM